MRELQEWSEFLLHSSTVIFTGSIGLMLGLFLVETLLTLLIGGGIGHVVDHAFGSAHPTLNAGHVPAAAGVHGSDGSAHAQASDGAHGGVLGWLQLGRVPFMIWLVVLLTTFGLLGLGGQAAMKELTGHFLNAWFAAPLVFVASLPVVRKVSRVFARLVPQEESSAVGEDHFLGREAVVMLGVATTDEPAEAKVMDMYGRSHYVRVVPTEGSAPIASGTRVTLMRQLSSGKFSAEPLLGTLPAPSPTVDLFSQALRETTPSNQPRQG